MTDTIKFRCGNCQKKIAVRAAYAGKKAKCPGCSQPLRVPAPKAERSATGVPVTAGASAGDASSAGASSISLDALAAMEENATAELKELSPRAAAQPAAMRVAGGKACPSCDASVKPDAMICVHCGHDFESGKQHKTQKDSKVGKAFTAVKSSAGSTQANGPSTLLSIRYVIGGVALTGLGISMAFFDFRPDSENSSTRKTEFLSNVLSFFFDTLGGPLCGGILILIGLSLLVYGLGVIKRFI